MFISTQGIWTVVFLALEKKKYIAFLVLHTTEDNVHGCFVDAYYSKDKQVRDAKPHIDKILDDSYH